MGLFYKHIIHPLISKSLGKKSFTNDPYLGMCIEADENDVIADEQFRIGMAYQYGISMLPKDNKKALEYYRKAAERGHAVAQVSMVMGMMRYNDDHNDEVMNWLHKAASQGERQAMYNLAISYHRGDIGGKPDIAKSTELFRRSAEKGYGAACSRYAILFLNGEDMVNKNLAVAKFWALEAYGFGDEQDGEVLRGIISEEDLVDGKINATKIYNEAAQAGESHALYKIGNAFMERDMNKAAELWQKASDMGSNYAKCNLAIYYRQERKDYVTSNRLFEEVANNGIEEACQALAESLYYGFGVEKDVMQALEWNEKALNLGYTPARYLLAVMYLQNSLDEILPDKVMRGMSYMEQAAQDKFPLAIKFFENQASAKLSE